MRNFNFTCSSFLILFYSSSSSLHQPQHLSLFQSHALLHFQLPTCLILFGCFCYLPWVSSLKIILMDWAKDRNGKEQKGTIRIITLCVSECTCISYSWCLKEEERTERWKAISGRCLILDSLTYWPDLCPNYEWVRVCEWCACGWGCWCWCVDVYMCMCVYVYMSVYVCLFVCMCLYDRNTSASSFLALIWHTHKHTHGRQTVTNTPNETDTHTHYSLSHLSSFIFTSASPKCDSSFSSL